MSKKKQKNIDNFELILIYTDNLMYFFYIHHQINGSEKCNQFDNHSKSSWL